MSDTTLKKLAGKTLAERARLFEVDFPGKRLTMTKLRTIYR
jgi:hypothetical protein